MVIAKIPARLRVILARESDYAVVIRRGPSKKTAVFRWNRKDDSFTIGQWFKGYIYEHYSDISPNGQYWLYAAMSDKTLETYTAIAGTPYLKAIDFYKGVLSNYGYGGCFLSNREYILNVKVESLEEQRKNSFFKVSEKQNSEYIYFTRLKRDGWIEEASSNTARGIHLFLASGLMTIGNC